MKRIRRTIHGYQKVYSTSYDHSKQLCPSDVSKKWTKEDKQRKLESVMSRYRAN